MHSNELILSIMKLKTNKRAKPFISLLMMLIIISSIIYVGTFFCGCNTNEITRMHKVSVRDGFELYLYAKVDDPFQKPKRLKKVLNVKGEYLLFLDLMDNQVKSIKMGDLLPYRIGRMSKGELIEIK